MNTLYFLLLAFFIFWRIGVEDEKNKWKICPTCNGDGKARIRLSNGEKELVTVEHNDVCGHCHGKGEIKVRD